MAEGPIHALTAGQLKGVFFDGRQHLLVAGDHVILAEKETLISHRPCIAPGRSGGFLVWVH